MEFMPETIYDLLQQSIKLNQKIPLITIKLYMYQLFRSLAYAHTLGVCHRDIKPENLLIQPMSGILKLCDFGSAKEINGVEHNLSYICSRYYRAPELTFGATDYTSSIDIWSSGCVLAELLLGSPLFVGKKSQDQIIEIMNVLGTPSINEINKMNPNYINGTRTFPIIEPVSILNSININDKDAIDLLSIILKYDPTQRPTASEAMIHPFFDELRQPETKQVTGINLPELFNFSQQELSIRPDLISKLIPQ